MKSIDNKNCNRIPFRNSFRQLMYAWKHFSFSSIVTITRVLSRSSLTIPNGRKSTTKLSSQCNCCHGIWFLSTRLALQYLSKRFKIMLIALLFSLLSTSIQPMNHAMISPPLLPFYECEPT